MNSGIKYYRLVNELTGKVLRLSHNETDIKVVIEDLLLYASVDNPHKVFGYEDLPVIMHECHIRCESSDEPYIFTDDVITKELFLTEIKSSKYKPKGRVYSNHFLCY